MIERNGGSMEDMISRKAAIDAIMDADVCVTWNGVISDDDAVDIAIKSTKGSVISSIVNLPSAQPEKRTENTRKTHACDCISRQAAIDAIRDADVCVQWNGIISDEDAVDITVKATKRSLIYSVKKLPSAQPFHNITMDDVLKFIDRMPEDVWQEFTACLECRGWELQRRTAKWCGSEFA